MSTPRKPRSKGLHVNRFRDNPEEKRFSDAWLAETEREMGTSILAYLLNTGAQDYRPADPSERDQVVAATVIQWLGSPVGQGFLRDLGYTRPEDVDVSTNDPLLASVLGVRHDPKA
jgi:hypothetical protein